MAPPPQQSVDVALLLLTAPGDGVGPSAILSLFENGRQRLLGQYLIAAPEGLSRLLLEHRARPGLSLRAALLPGCSAEDAGGLAGLLLRLKQDGHGSLVLLGPKGAHHTLPCLATPPQVGHCLAAEAPLCPTQCLP
jgi:hypothetical protein